MPLKLLTLLLLATTTHAQWTLQDSHTTADLRGIDNVGKRVAWASGTDGTILRTEDAGYMWQICSKPPNGEHLDFRAIQAFDNNTAIIMSAGKGPLSRLYKTTDGCQSWHLLFTNPDKDGFWDALAFGSERSPKERGGVLLGDPIRGRFDDYTILLAGGPSGEDSVRRFALRPRAQNSQAIFAASNSSLFFLGFDQPYWFVTGGQGGAEVFKRKVHVAGDMRWDTFQAFAVPVGTHTETSGAFSIAFALEQPDARDPQLSRPTAVGVVVGGDFTKPEQGVANAAFTADGGQHWLAAQIPPHGYRSAVAYDSQTKTWITVGPNGTDISTDDGRNWRPLHPDPAFHDTPDADQHWNALSLPYVVGPHGRIATLRPSALTPSSK